ncbi:MAG: histidine phosphatase family protein [Planctomycetota bacterium]|nr:histidine phosphatase family protein [Planctomycetota bacterium]
MQVSHPLKFAAVGLALWALVALALSAHSRAGAGVPEAPPRPTTLVLVRHGEKDPAGDARDPGLSKAGAARAERLAQLLEAAGVTHLFATEYHRTQDTLAPLAARVSKQVEIVPGAKTEDLLRALDALPAGSIAVVAGHSNTVPKIAEHFGVLLGGTEKSVQGPVLPETAFDRVYAITLPSRGSSGAWSLLELRY